MFPATCPGWRGGHERRCCALPAASRWSSCYGGEGALESVERAFVRIVCSGCAAVPLAVGIVWNERGVDVAAIAPQASVMRLPSNFVKHRAIVIFLPMCVASDARMGEKYTSYGQNYGAIIACNPE